MKKEKYELLREQICALIEGETDVVAMMANISSAIHETMGFWWTGFYRVKDGELILYAHRLWKGSLRYSVEGTKNNHRA